MQFLAENWKLIILISIALTILIVLLWRNYDIDEITPAPPFVKFKRKSSSTNSSQQASINIKGNKMWGKNKIGVRRESTNVSDNKMIGKNEIEVGAKPGRKSKGVKKK
ncbi:MAG: hypothetical protein IH589_05470 [Anaerolineales bacterium]|nr:hypothetical protein [Anaerolineales bacterium]